MLVPERIQEKDPLIGAILGDRYLIDSVLGKGSMGVVYLAKHQLIDRMIAVKVLRSELAADDDSLLRFQSEVRAASRLHHPNVVSVHDCGVTETGQPYLVMDYVQGNNIADIIKCAGCIEYGRALSIFIQACNGLEHAHRLQIIHRHIKPSNIALIRIEEQPELVKVLDFGAAKLLSQEEQQLHLTKTGELLGSPHYMSPEQCRGSEIDERSDVYSLGATLYEALIGAPPHQGKNAMEIISRQVSETPRSFAEAFPELPIPEIIEAVVFRSLEKERERRFQSMAEMQQALQRALDSIYEGDDATFYGPPSSAAEPIALNPRESSDSSAESERNGAALPVGVQTTTAKADQSGGGKHRSLRIPALPALLGLIAVVLLVSRVAWLLQSSQSNPAGEVQGAIYYLEQGKNDSVLHLRTEDGQLLKLTYPNHGHQALSGRRATTNGAIWKIAYHGAGSSLVMDSGSFTGNFDQSVQSADQFLRQHFALLSQSLFRNAYDDLSPDAKTRQTFDSFLASSQRLNFSRATQRAPSSAIKIIGQEGNTLNVLVDLQWLTEGNTGFEAYTLEQVDGHWYIDKIETSDRAAWDLG